MGGWRANFRKSLARLACFEGAILTAALFEGANLTEVNFNGADLQNARFLGAILTGATFSGADLRNAVYNEKTVWPENFIPLDHGAIPVDYRPKEDEELDRKKTGEEEK